jgi:hypothetical protein
VLVVADGAPSSRHQAELSLQAVANKVKAVEDVTLSFLQVGSDKVRFVCLFARTVHSPCLFMQAATEFLDFLDNDLVCKYGVLAVQWRAVIVRPLTSLCLRRIDLIDAVSTA